MMISLFVRACLLGGPTGCELSVGAEPSPSQATGAADSGAHPFPSAQQFASINAAKRNEMHFEIIVVTLRHCDRNVKKRCRARVLRAYGNKRQFFDLRRFSNAKRLHSH